MDLVIKKLTPEMANDYLHFFDTTPHYDGAKCYCITWRNDETYSPDTPSHWFPTAEERRSKAEKFVKEGSIKGYLAYLDGEAVGWCNTNENCNLCIEYLSTIYPLEPRQDGIKIKPIFCFVINPEHQRKGIATRLVEQICIDAANEGFDYVEAYVNDEFINTDDDFRGPIKMYEKCGFVKDAEYDKKVVMRKKLK